MSRRLSLGEARWRVGLTWSFSLRAVTSPMMESAHAAADRGISGSLLDAGGRIDHVGLRVGERCASFVSR